VGVGDRPAEEPRSRPNKEDKDIWLLALRRRGTRASSRATRAARHGRDWSPTGKQLLIRSARPSSGFYELSGGDAHAVTRLSAGRRGGLSPDGRWIAFKAARYTRSAEATDACNKERGEKAREEEWDKARIVDPSFARHWSEWKEGSVSNVFVMPAGAGRPADVTRDALRTRTGPPSGMGGGRRLPLHAGRRFCLIFS